MNRIITREVYGYSSSHICGGSVRCYRKWRRSCDRKWRRSPALSGGMLCACATGSRTISSLVGPFSPEATKSRDRKSPYSEVCSAHVRLFPAFFNTRVVVQFWSKVTVTGRGSVRKYVLLMPGYFPRFVLVVVHNVGWGCSLRRPRPITIGNSRHFIFI
jgi:hypothetical protein